MYVFMGLRGRSSDRLGKGLRTSPRVCRDIESATDVIDRREHRALIGL